MLLSNKIKYITFAHYLSQLYKSVIKRNCIALKSLVKLKTFTVLVFGIFIFNMEEIVEEVTELYKQGDWKTIVKKFRTHPNRNKVLWVFPTEENFKFIGICMVKLNCEAIVSVGCGSGLLEWMITEATGYPTSGIEVDGAWWHCKYAPPTFIPLLLTNQKLDKEIVTLLRNCHRTALLFCYFNNGLAFKEYLDKFSGNVLIIIGPGHGKSVHTDPRPFGDVPDQWILHESQEVESTKDYIAVYYRK